MMSVGPLILKVTFMMSLAGFWRVLIECFPHGGCALSALAGVQMQIISCPLGPLNNHETTVH